ncbi:MAG: type II toxin-antitoxin system RelE/ParE family toxin [Methanospirillaceae archaeon]|nr:type II toxin-antitoxin system RelE/ParE family toxin [Methanospirillaceae archaeon]
MSPFRVIIKRPAEDWLRRQPIEIQSRFATKIRKLKEYPEIFGKPLRGRLHGYWELYFEHRYRIIYTINRVEGVVSIEALWHKDDF